MAAARVGVAVIASAAVTSEWWLAPLSPDAGLLQRQITCSALQDEHGAELRRITQGKQTFTDGEAWRPQFTALEYAKRGIGIANSLHTMRLARDKNLVIDGKVTFENVDYEQAGKLWLELGKKRGIDVAWGGDFKSVDSVHFSCPYQGVK